MGRPRSLDEETRRLYDLSRLYELSIRQSKAYDESLKAVPSGQYLWVMSVELTSIGGASVLVVWVMVRVCSVGWWCSGGVGSTNEWFE